MHEAVIRLRFNNVVTITTEEYLDIQQTLIARGLADPGCPGDRILQRLLTGLHSRYVECVEQNKNLIRPGDTVVVSPGNRTGTVVHSYHESYDVELSETGQVDRFQCFSVAKVQNA